ncbi:AraC family transcriptional regulator [Caulobacter sp. Root655]|uniref:DJ-1/PfpI family protein n=1 Tax=Caulobacter sp. Root655 TaxID=1736578 RepID=UPI0006F435FE|nr:DJ-1/PfpI family protein [Caulobacter sp. Root655]KRA59329.1 AraC family transcriptional regulator [Caulobacter sp. Root655]
MTAAAKPPPVFTVGIVLYPGFDILDVAGPHEVFGFFDGAVIGRTVKVATVAQTKAALPTSGVLRVLPEYDFGDCPPIDLLFVPGGGDGLDKAIGDQALLAFLRKAAKHARYVAGVCTGGLLLGAAGLLDGYQATTHWGFIDCLKLFPKVKVVNGCPRWVRDRNRITGGGISSSIDESLFLLDTLVSDLAPGKDKAALAELTTRQVQLSIQYNPQPPFSGGDPCSVDYAVFEPVNAGMAGFREIVSKAILARP